MDTTESYFQRLRNLNIGLNSAIDNKDKTKQVFLEIIKVIKEYYNSEKNGKAAYPNPIACKNIEKTAVKTEDQDDIQQNRQFFEMEMQILVKNMEVCFEKYTNARDMQQGLVFLGNLILYHNQNLSKSMTTFIKHLVNFYTQLDCQENNYQTLALLAQILDSNKNNAMKNEKNLHKTSEDYTNTNSNQTHDSSDIEYSSNSETQQYDISNSSNSKKRAKYADEIFKKTFVVKVLSIDMDDIENEKRQKETIKMVGILMTYFSKNLEKIREFRQLNQLKLFLLKNIKDASSLPGLSKMTGNMIYCLCQLTQLVKFNEKEILKNRTVEILIKFVEKNQPQLLLFGALKLLKVLWRAQIRKTALIKQGLVRRLINIYYVQPKLILSFIEEMFESEQQRLLDEFPEFFQLLLETVYRNQSKTQNQEIQILLRILSRLQNDKTGNMLQTLGQGLMFFLTKQFQSKQQDPRVAQALNILFSKPQQQQAQQQQQQASFPPQFQQQPQQTVTPAPAPATAHPNNNNSAPSLSYQVRIPHEIQLMMYLRQSQNNYLRAESNRSQTSYVIPKQEPNSSIEK